MRVIDGPFCPVTIERAPSAGKPGKPSDDSQGGPGGVGLTLTLRLTDATSGGTTVHRARLTCNFARRAVGSEPVTSTDTSSPDARSRRSLYVSARVRFRGGGRASARLGEVPAHGQCRAKNWSSETYAETQPS
jgi:hypothetical protein